MASAEDDEYCVVRVKETRNTPPSHYVLKLDSFSLFSKNGVDQIKSNSFRVGDHQWKIILFPNGNSRGKDDHVSLYLMWDISSSLLYCKGTFVNAIIKFFLLDQIRGNYLTVQGKASRFDSLKCFSSEGSRLGECHSISKVANISGSYKWVVTKFSELGKHLYSDEFVVGGYKWKIQLYPEGVAKYKGFSLSMYLGHVDSKSSMTEHKVKAEFALTLTDQLKQNHIKNKTTTWFGASKPDWGWSSFIELKDFKDDKKGYLVGDQCIIEAEVKVLCEGSCETLKC